jgi:hypothetical protein
MAIAAIWTGRKCIKISRLLTLTHNAHIPPIPLQLSLKIGYVLLHFCIVAYFATTGGGVRELTNALPESIYTSSLSKGGFKLPPLLNVLVTTALDAPPYHLLRSSRLIHLSLLVIKSDSQLSHRKLPHVFGIISSSTKHLPPDS